MNIPNLDGKVVVVTGAGRGIGAASVARLLGAGAKVVGLAIAGSASPDLDASASGLTVVPTDVRSTDSVAKAVDIVRSTHGRLDALVNNAGIIEPIGPIGEVDPDAWGEVLTVNATGAMRCTNAFLPLLRESRGTIVNMSSGAAYRPLEGWSAYCASKAALVMLSRATDLEYRDRGIRVFALGIPPTDTGMQALIRRSGINDVSKIPQAKLTPPAVTASVVTWLCGPDARQLDKLELDVRDPEFAAFHGSV